MIRLINVPDGTYEFMLTTDIVVEGGKIVALNVKDDATMIGNAYNDGTTDVGLVRDDLLSTDLCCLDEKTTEVVNTMKSLGLSAFYTEDYLEFQRQKETQE